MTPKATRYQDAARCGVCVPRVAVENGRADRCVSFGAKLCVAGGGAGYYIFTTIGAWTAGERLRPSSRKLDAKPHALRGFAIHVPGG